MNIGELNLTNRSSIHKFHMRTQNSINTIIKSIIYVNTVLIKLFVDKK